MKIRDLIILLTLTILYTSCNKNELYIDHLENELIFYNDLRNIEDISSRKLAYAQLSSKERYMLWKQRFNEFSESDKYNNIQKALFNEINKKLSLNVFVDGSDEKEIFHNVEIIDWLKKAVNSFSEEEIRSTIFSIPSTNLDIDTFNESKLVEPEEMCICSKTSAYSCWHIVVAWPPEVGYGDCSGGNCVEERGCGALWDLTCDGSICNF